MGIGSNDRQTAKEWHKFEGETDFNKGGAPERNLNAMKHGVWANRFLDDEECEVFQDVAQRFNEDFEFNHSSDFTQVELVAIYTVKLMRALAAGDMEAAERIDRMLRSHLKDLKSTKITRQKEEPPKQEMTPAEWATSFIEKMRKKQEEEKKAEEKSAEQEKQEKNA